MIGMTAGNAALFNFIRMVLEFDHRFHPALFQHSLNQTVTIGTIISAVNGDFLFVLEMIRPNFKAGLTEKYIVVVGFWSQWLPHPEGVRGFRATMLRMVALTDV